MSEIAWAAGFFDGEGCTQVREDGFLTISVVQKDRRPLERFELAAGCGKIYGPYGKASVSKWAATGATARNVLAVLWPYLSEPKREQARAAIAVHEARPRKRRARGEYMKRSTCSYGHELTYYGGQGRRRCKECDRLLHLRKRKAAHH